MRNGDWIQTYTGKKFYPLDPHPEDICIEDIAHALSLTCRYNGHCNKFYSVAQHSILMAENDLPGSKSWRLLHDAAEAYICDVPKPVKGMLPGYKQIEEVILSVIAEVFSLGVFNHDEISRADMVMLATEKRDVLSDGPQWGLALPEPLEIIINPWDCEYSESKFMALARELGIPVYYSLGELVEG